MGVRAATCVFMLGEGELRELLNTPLEHVPIRGEVWAQTLAGGK